MQEPYLVYVLRLWKTGDAESAQWRALLENPHTGECRAFDTREALLAYIDTLTSDPPALQVSVNGSAPP